MEEVVENLKACLLSSKGGINESRLNKDYYALVGEAIPYRELNFRTLEEFVLAVPGIKRVRKGDEYFIQAIPSEKTSHLAALVRGQKPERKPKRKSSQKRAGRKNDGFNQNLQNSVRLQTNTRTTDSFYMREGIVSSQVKGSTIGSKTNSFRKGNTNNQLSEEIQRTLPNPENELQALATDLELTFPTYKFFSAKKGTVVYAQVVVGKNKYSSYPQDAKSSRAAQFIAIQKALDDLKEKNRSVLLPFTRDEELIKERILKILDCHSSGIFSSQLTRYYEEEFKELLPEDWMRIVNGYSEISVETGVNNTTILTRYIPLQAEVQKTAKIVEWPDDPYVLIHVSEVCSTTEIWCQIMGENYNEKLEEMYKTMKKFYTTNLSSMKVNTAVPGSNYVICLEDKWYRVKCQEYDPENKKAMIYFIDNGKNNTCHAELLYNLDKQFCELPNQAVRLSLYDLEEFSDCKEAETIVRNCLLNKTLCVQTQSLDFEDGGRSVIFYDFDGPDLIDLNKLMSIEIIRACVTEPQLKPERRITDVYVSHISESGDIFVRLMNDDLKYIETRINTVIEEKLGTREVGDEITVDLLKLYLVKSHDGKWYRAGLIDINKERKEVVAFLLDSGNTITANVADLVDLENVSTILANFPAQAIKLELHNVPASSFDQEKVARLKEIVPPNQHLLVRVVRRPFNGSLPIVEMYKRKQPSNEIVSINNTLIVDSELFANFDKNNNDEAKKRSDRLTKHSLSEISRKRFEKARSNNVSETL